MLTAGVTPLFGDQVIDYNDHYRHQQTGSYAADEHFTDGSIGQSAVHNHGVAGRDNQSDGAGSGNHSSGKGFIVAPLFHLSTITAPIAEVVAGAEPEIAPKKVEDSVAT